MCKQLCGRICQSCQIYIDQTLVVCISSTIKMPFTNTSFRASPKRDVMNLSDKRLRCIRRSRTHTIANYREQSSASDVMQYSTAWFEGQESISPVDPPCYIVYRSQIAPFVIESTHAYHLHILALYLFLDSNIIEVPTCVLDM